MKNSNLLPTLAALSVLLLGSSKFAAADDFAEANVAEPRPDIVSDVPDEVLSELGQFIHNPSDGAYVYSYQDLSKIEALHLDARRFPESAGNYYWDKTQDAHTGGHFKGLYLASDPISSRDYAGNGKNFILYRFELPKTARILDVHDFRYGKTPTFTNYVNQNGCPDGIMLQNLVNEGYGLACRTAAIKILKALRIDIIEYSFWGVKFNGCDSAKDTGWAMLLIRPDHIPTSNIKLFSAFEKEDSDHGKERAFIRSLFAENIQENQNDPNALLPKTLGFPGSRVASELELKTFKEHHLINCQNLAP